MIVKTPLLLSNLELEEACEIIWVGIIPDPISQRSDSWVVRPLSDVGSADCRGSCCILSPLDLIYEVWFSLRGCLRGATCEINARLSRLEKEVFHGRS
jgi:hypothetical protein